MQNTPKMRAVLAGAAATLGVLCMGMPAGWAQQTQQQPAASATPTAADREALIRSALSAAPPTLHQTVKVMDFDVVSGDMTIAGRYRSQDSGTRVEINPGGNAPDEIRFYQGSVYGYIGAESAPGGTAARKDSIRPSLQPTSTISPAPARSASTRASPSKCPCMVRAPDGT